MLSKKIAILGATALLLFMCWHGNQDELAATKVNAGMVRALASFATARSLNAAISVAQESSVSASVLGVGGTLAIGQLLDPINDLIESFSSLMLIACVAFGTEAILIEIGGEWILMVVFSMAIIVWSVISVFGNKPPLWLSRIALIMVMIRFAIPMTVIGSDIIFERFLSKNYTESQSVVSKATKTLEEINYDKPKQAVINPEEEPGIIEKYTGIKPDTIKMPDFSIVQNTKLKYESLMSELNGAVRNTITLIVIFMLQTVFVPIFILWAIYGIFRSGIEISMK